MNKAIIGIFAFISVNIQAYEFSFTNHTNYNLKVHALLAFIGETPQYVGEIKPGETIVKNFGGLRIGMCISRIYINDVEQMVYSAGPGKRNEFIQQKGDPYFMRKRKQDGMQDQKLVQRRPLICYNNSFDIFDAGGTEYLVMMFNPALQW